GLGSGRVTLEAVGGELDIRGGRIDVAGGEGGKVRFRARQRDDHAGVHVAALNADIVGARSTVLEGVSRYTRSTTSAARPEALADAAVFAANAATIANNLGLGSDVKVMAGMEIESAGDLTVDADWNLFADFNGLQREGTLTLRAGGNLIVNGNISDGFNVAD